MRSAAIILLSLGTSLSLACAPSPRPSPAATPVQSVQPAQPASAVQPIGPVSPTRIPPRTAQAVAESAPLLITVAQRQSSTTGPLTLRVRDIAGGQVLTMIVDRNDNALLPLRSMKVGDSATFTHNRTTYTLTLTRLKNFLIGEDFAEFTLTPPPR